MRGNNKKMNSIFDNCQETDSQEIFLRRCGFAQRGVPPDSDPSILGLSQSPSPLNNGISPPHDSVTVSVINPGYEVEEYVESHAVRFVSPPESPSTTTVDSEEDRTVPVESRVDLENQETPAKKLKIPVRDVVKAIVVNSRSTEEDGEVEKKKEKSCVQVLKEKGFSFD
ncbi:unnamed protein product [Eruca vesicaria subsp. sativa]|uniref:Uncharacterized protein n=1 Tax=Eruca vesicaria subsp. sativa TaxID=29727 RepID=A0ABC8ISX3_ERUVS|nr:unnamed protein product [Eruca vesicaria subsp. sativa]